MCQIKKILATPLKTPRCSYSESPVTSASDTFRGFKDHNVSIFQRTTNTIGRKQVIFEVLSIEQMMSNLDRMTSTEYYLQKLGVQQKFKKLHEIPVLIVSLYQPLAKKLKSRCFWDVG